MISQNVFKCLQSSSEVLRCFAKDLMLLQLGQEDLLRAGNFGLP